MQCIWLGQACTGSLCRHCRHAENQPNISFTLTHAMQDVSQPLFPPNPTASPSAMASSPGVPGQAISSDLTDLTALASTSSGAPVFGSEVPLSSPSSLHSQAFSSSLGFLADCLLGLGSQLPLSCLLGFGPRLPLSHLSRGLRFTHRVQNTFQNLCSLYKVLSSCQRSLLLHICLLSLPFVFCLCNAI